MEQSNRFEVNEVDLVYRKSTRNHPTVDSSRAAFEILLDSWDRDKIEYVEQFKVLLLDKACRVLGLFVASSGGTSATIMEPKVIMVAALKTNASVIILAHNHPSGRLRPSKSDIANTSRLRDAGELLDIHVFDHIILTASGYFSFGDDGLL